ATRAAELEPPDSTWRPAIAAVLGAYRFMSGAKSGYYPLLIEGAQAAVGPPEIAAYALGNLALIHAWRDEWEQASQYADEVVGQLEDGLAYSLPIYGLAYAVAAHAAVLGADTAQSEKLLTVAVRSEQQAPDSMPFDSAVLRTAIAEALVDMGRYREAGGFVHRALQNIASMGEGGYVEKRLDRVVRHLSKAGAETGDRNLEAPAIGALLSTRELQVLGLLATDLTLAEIGSQLYLSLNTVKTHTRRTYRKLDVHTRQQAVAAGRTLGYL
ncbi:MAG: LuxR C-terminal-related transcriptional regulator, partial [Gammaproteobacteria bacterium]|nr:LuxR C-terminal-related transcriptional regulator [Gammaproteobacteria bacterium]